MTTTSRKHADHEFLSGVNLGGWLIPEKWLTPSVFASTDSQDLHELLATKEGEAAYLRHVDSFIAEHDFAWIASQDIRLIRLPVGYWDFQGSEGITTAKVDWAMKMAEKYGLKVLLDFHGAKGSQNGYEHSGKQGKVGWWSHRQAALEALERIAKRYRGNKALWGIELLNEPRVGFWRHFSLVRFYRIAYICVQKQLRPGAWIVFHDAFHPLLLAGALRNRRKNPVAIDIHWYGIPTRISGGWKLATYTRVQRLVTGLMLRFVRLWHPVIVGEWSAVAPQDYMERAKKADYEAIWRQNGEAQQAMYTQLAVAAIYWTYKGEGRGVWHFRSMVEDGVLKP